MLLIKLWFKTTNNHLTDSYILVKGRLILVEPLVNELKVIIEIDGLRSTIICNYVSTFNLSRTSGEKDIFSSSIYTDMQKDKNNSSHLYDKHNICKLGSSSKLEE